MERQRAVGQECAAARLWALSFHGMSVSADLAVDEIEAALGVRDRLANVGGSIQWEVAMLDGRDFGVGCSFDRFAGEEHRMLRRRCSDVALRMLVNLAE